MINKLIKIVTNLNILAWLYATISGSMLIFKNHIPWSDNTRLTVAIIAPMVIWITFLIVKHQLKK